MDGAVPAYVVVGVTRKFVTIISVNGRFTGWPVFKTLVHPAILFRVGIDHVFDGLVDAREKGVVVLAQTDPDADADQCPRQVLVEDAVDELEDFLEVVTHCESLWVPE